MLCEACHREVKDSVSRRQFNPIISAFNADTFRDFVQSPRPAQFVLPIAKIDKSPIINIDVKRCRRSCLMEATEHWPVFSVHDEIHEVASSKRNLSDFNWIDKGNVKTARRKLKDLPYQGARWYARQAARWLLMRGIINWNDVKLGLDATAHLQPDIFRQPLEQIQETIHHDFRKKAINALLGIWSIDKRGTHIVTTQFDKYDVLYNGQITTRDAPGGMFDLIYAQEQSSTHL